MFSKQAVRLMILLSMMSFASLLSNVFVNIFLWKITSDMRSLAIYNLTLYAACALTIPVFGWVMKRYSAMLVFRLSILFSIAYFSCIILCAGRIEQILYLLGTLSGIGTASNVNSSNQLTVRFTQPENRSRFLSYSNVLNSAASMVCPLISGVLIMLFDDLYGYYVLFGISIALYLASFVLCSWFEEQHAARPFRFFYTWRTCSPLLRRVNLTQFIIGLRDGIFDFLINVLIFDIVKNEGLFGAATSFSRLIIVIFYWAAGRWVHKDNLYKHLRYSMWLMWAAPIPLFVLANTPGMIAQTIMNAIAAPIVAITLNSLNFNSIERASRNDDLEESLALKEVCLNTGKATGVAIFLVMQSYLTTGWIYAILLILNLCYVASYYIYRGAERKVGAAEAGAV